MNVKNISLLVLGLYTIGCDKEVSNCHTYKFERDSVEVCVYDRDGDGKIDQVFTYFPDKNGKIREDMR